MKNIVVIGGGTGTYITLTGLKEYPVNLSAIVAMSDSGGSTGILRDELGALPPGDIRRALVALSQSPQIIRDLFNYRFEKAVEEAGKILSIRGQVIPVTKDSTHLHAILEDGTEIAGETNIDIPKHNGRLRISKVKLKPKARATKAAIDAIKNADLIVLSPGDLFTSLIPNLLVSGIPEAVKKSRARLVYACNLTTKHGETDGFNADDFVINIEKYLGGRKIDYVVTHNDFPSKKLLAKYRKEKKEPVLIAKNKKNRTYKLIRTDIAATEC